MSLPIDTILPKLVAALKAKGRAVLQAPPGAGKTTRVPLALLPECGGRIIMLEPRRLAARAAAERMASSLGERVGETIGYRIRGDQAIGPATRIEVVTEGILTNMIQSDPELTGISAVIFDEFHERSLNADLGLALAWEVRGALREDLWLVVMSATLDAGPVAMLLDEAPLISSEGRAFPVETIWLDKPLAREMRLERAMADLILAALKEGQGGCLAFLPGEGEIRRCAALLSDHLPPDIRLHRLFGAMPLADQRAAMRPETSGRKLVLATSIAETSLTIEDIRIVVDSGRSRRSRFDPASGMSRLVTEPVSRAEADQRRGRAGRVAPGRCYRLWTRGGEGALPAFPPPEISATDLAPLALELARWGASGGLSFLTQPPETALAEARALLVQLEALDDRERITEHGRALAKIPLHPRLAHMLVRGGAGAARLAALMAERDPAPHLGTDLARKVKALAARSDPGLDRSIAQRIGQEAKRLARFEGRAAFGPGAQAALAYPDRIGLRRNGDAPRYLLSGGKGAVLPEGDPLAGQRLIVATDLDGNPREARIRQAIAVSEAEIRELFGERIEWHQICHWSRRERRVQAREQERLGALVLSDRIWRDAPNEAIGAAVLDGIRQLGLDCFNWSKRAKLLRARIAFSGVLEIGDDALLEQLEDWAMPFLSGVSTAEKLASFDPSEALEVWLGWERMRDVDRLAPRSWTSPLGRRVAIDYSGDVPAAELRLQEVFGTNAHPTIGPDALPLRLSLLSPAGRPVQVTTDLPGFWEGSYADVRKDMRARYPKHPWPEDPRVATPTLRAKRRGD